MKSPLLQPKNHLIPLFILHFHVIFVNREENLPSTHIRRLTEREGKQTNDCKWKRPLPGEHVTRKLVKIDRRKHEAPSLCWFFPFANWCFQTFPHFLACTQSDRFACRLAPRLLKWKSSSGDWIFDRVVLLVSCKWCISWRINRKIPENLCR